MREDVFELLQEVYRVIDQLPGDEDALHRAARIMRESREMEEEVRKAEWELKPT